MGQISLSLPQVGQTNASQEPLIPGDFTTIQNVINGNLDSTNISNTLAQSAAVNTGTQTIKGVTNIATSESRTNVAYGTLTTPDQVTGIVLPSNGLIAVWYQATWQESVSNAARAAIFVGANQLKIGGLTAANTEAAVTPTGGTTAVDRELFSSAVGLMSGAGSSSYTGDVTTGQAVGVGTSGVVAYFDINGGAFSVSGFAGGPCWVFAAAGTYTVSVQFKSSSGSVTASNRKLWVQALSFG